MGATANSFAERSCGFIRALVGAGNDGPENTPENWLGGSAGSEDGRMSGWLDGLKEQRSACKSQIG
jgi:hypothetical protein